MKQTFCVVYRTGGYRSFSWHRTLPVATRQEAITQHDEIVAQGYAAFVADYIKSTAHGLPETHCADKTCPCVKAVA